MPKLCPHCHESIDHLDWTADETSYGTAYGTMNESGDEETDGNDTNDSEYNNQKYKCPKCEHSMEYDFFEQDDDTDEIPEPVPPEENEGHIFERIDNKYHSGSNKLNKEFKAFLQSSNCLSDEEEHAEEEELIEMYQNEYHDFCQLNK